MWSHYYISHFWHQNYIFHEARWKNAILKITFFSWGLLWLTAESRGNICLLMLVTTCYAQWYMQERLTLNRHCTHFVFMTLANVSLLQTWPEHAYNYCVILLCAMPMPLYHNSDISVFPIRHDDLYFIVEVRPDRCFLLLRLDLYTGLKAGDLITFLNELHSQKCYGGCPWLIHAESVFLTFRSTVNIMIFKVSSKIYPQKF